MKVVTADIMQKLDRMAIDNCGIPGIVLMENAGRGAKRIVECHYPDLFNRKVAVFSGRGNNGGDGYVIARHLSNSGIDVKVFLLTVGDNLRGDAKINFDIIRRMGVDIFELKDESHIGFIRDQLKSFDLIIDAIFGTGLNSDVRGIFREIIEFINKTGIQTVSIDIPSGLCADTGMVLGSCIQADLTITFAYPKLGLLIHQGPENVGKLETIDISIPGYLIEDENIQDHLIVGNELRSLIQPRQPDSHKGDFGHLLVLAGSMGKTGAAVLTSLGAMRAGVGLVTLGIPESLNHIMESKLTEVMTEPLIEYAPGFLGIKAFEKIMELTKDKNALALGPGLSTKEETAGLIASIIKETTIPIVIDADGINALAKNKDSIKEAKAPVVLTPHPGEMARLTGNTVAEIQNNRIEVSRSFAKEYVAYIVLKGFRTVITDPNGDVYINPTGNPGMATAGMGDVLTGMISSFIAQGLDITDAAKLAVFSHGLAGDTIVYERGEVGLLASDVIEKVPSVLFELRDFSKS
ncbi:MAG: NAD(P)H-hydrate dehydratase [Thermodesulfobacteriota bacterium]|nr:NAD(P)H-hydrate dehydratase [Thermodesulfobacteriota bacterium]